MSKTTHTPGPWFPSGEDNQIRANTRDGHTTICEMWSTDQDAQLICDASEMLAYIEFFVLACDAANEREELPECFDDAVVERARAIIDKAKRGTI